MFFMLITYIVVKKPHAVGTWEGFTWEAFTGFKEFLSLALPGGNIHRPLLRCSRPIVFTSPSLRCFQL